MLYGWHFSVFFEAAVRHPFVHALQHMSFVAIGVLVWWSALEPKRRRFRGELWKVPYLIGARMAGMFLGMSFVLIRVPVYTGVYAPATAGTASPRWRDQQTAGAMMVAVDLLIMVFALCLLLLPRVAGRGRRGPAAARGAAHSTVSVPSMPPSRWPGTEQKNVYSPGWTSTSISDTSPSPTTSPSSLTPPPSSAMLWSVGDSLGERIVSAPAGAVASANW